MSEIKLFFNDDGVAELYDDTYDMTIHHETAEELERTKNILKNSCWIPVSDRLPDPDAYILLSFENFSSPMIGRYTVDDEDGGTFRIGDEDESFIENDLFVNAWMPLPEPYKGE